MVKLVFVIIHDGFERFEIGNEVARLTYLGNGNWWSSGKRALRCHRLDAPATATGGAGMNATERKAREERRVIYPATYRVRHDNGDTSRCKP